eukprot:Awhi_evm1s3816
MLGSGPSPPMVVPPQHYHSQPQPPLQHQPPPHPPYNLQTHYPVPVSPEEILNNANSNNSGNSNNNMNAMVIDNVEVEPVIESAPCLAYAKLQGPGLVHYVQTLQVSLGRKTAQSDSVDVDLGKSKSVS